MFQVGKELTEGRTLLFFTAVVERRAEYWSACARQKCGPQSKFRKVYVAQPCTPPYIGSLVPVHVTSGDLPLSLAPPTTPYCSITSSLICLETTILTRRRNLCHTIMATSYEPFNQTFKVALIQLHPKVRIPFALLSRQQ